MNREQELNKQFPLEDGTTYIQSIDKSNEPKGAGAGGESIKENFIDSSPNTFDSNDNTNDKRDIDFMYKWIRKHSNK
jgi:hypothetical protein